MQAPMLAMQCLCPNVLPKGNTLLYAMAWDLQCIHVPITVALCNTTVAKRDSVWNYAPLCHGVYLFGYTYVSCWCAGLHHNHII